MSTKDLQTLAGLTKQNRYNDPKKIKKIIKKGKNSNEFKEMIGDLDLEFGIKED